MRVKALFLTLLLWTAPTFAETTATGSECETLNRLVLLARIQSRLDGAADHEMTQVRQAQALFCGDLEFAKGATVYYSNGATATRSWAMPGSLWQYPDGEAITRSAGQQPGDWLYPNGRVATRGGSDRGTLWSYPNGQTASYAAGVEGESWYYPNGAMASANAGVADQTWYHHNGKVASWQAGTKNGSWTLSDGVTKWHQYKVHTSTELLAGDAMMLWLLIYGQ